MIESHSFGDLVVCVELLPSRQKPDDGLRLQVKKDIGSPIVEVSLCKVICLFCKLMKHSLTKSLLLITVRGEKKIEYN